MVRAALVTGLALLGVEPSGAATLHPNFQEQVVFTGLVSPTSVRFAPDGRIFVAEKRGTVQVYDSLTDTTPTQLADLRTQVHDFWDRGLLGMAIDPFFPAQPWVYVFYTLNWDSTAPQLGIPRWPDSCPSPPGPTGDGCVVDGRLSRLQVAPNGTLVGTEQVLLEKRWCQQFPSHSMGGLVFDPLERVLYLSAGEGSNFNGVDWGQEGGDPGSPTPSNPCGDPPVSVGGLQTSPTAEGGALRSQDLRTSGDPVSFGGALLRVDPDTGAAAPGNPLDGGDPEDDPIIAHGLRNPFRIAARPGSHEVWIGDVGAGAFEELNRVADGSDAVVENFGWPCYEGVPHMSGYAAADLNICENLYAAGSGAVQAPFYAYAHFQDVDADLIPFRCSGTASSSISGLAFESGNAYPPVWDKALFFADYSRSCIFVMAADPNGVPDPATRTTFVDMAAAPVDLTFGPDGQLYYPDFNGGRIMRVSYFVANEPPVAVLAADASNGALPLTIQFDGSGSSDPNPGDPLFYAWDLDGDGEFDDSTLPGPIQTYTTQGVITVGLRVTDGQGADDVDTLTLTAGNRPPGVSLLEPSPELLWRVGQTLLLRGAATDPEDGDLPPSALDWSIILHHCTPDLSTCHEHPLVSFEDVDELEWVTPDHEWRVFLEIVLTATDGGFAGGGGTLSAEARITLQPDAVTLTFDSQPAGLVLGVGNVAETTPFARQAVIGSVTGLAAPTPQDAFGNSWEFVSWSDGGPAAHAVTAPEGGMSFTAAYAWAGQAPDWWQTAWRRRVRVVFDNAGQATDLMDMPVLVRLDGTVLDYADTRDSGQDVRFVDADGVTILAHETERWDESGTSILWVRVPRVDAGSSTDFIWMYYGNPAAPDAQNPASVWSPDYVGVWHLGSALIDSTAYGHHATNNGSTQVAGAFGGARHFNGASWVAVPSTPNLALTGSLTIEAWARIDDPDLVVAMRVLDKKIGFDGTTGYNLEIHPANNSVTNLTSGTDFGRATAVDLDTSWHMVGATVQGTTSRVWVDGVDFTTDSTCNPLAAGTLDLHIGKRSGGNSGFFLGALDEIRLARVARSPDWTRAQYLSMSGAFAGLQPAEDNCGPVDATCDGWDDDCDAQADEDIPSPALVGGLAVDPGSLIWVSVPGADRYSVVRGGLEMLHASNGDWESATEACLTSSATGTTTPLAPGEPPAGDGWWYLIRSHACTLDGSWDDDGPAQVGSRDAGLAAAPLGCP